MLSIGKIAVGQHRYHEQQVAGESTQNLLCAYLATGVLTGLLLSTPRFGLWWADPAAPLAIAALAIHEGQQTWRGESCCAAPPVPGATLARHGNCCN